MIRLSLVLDLSAPVSASRAALESLYHERHLPWLRALLAWTGPGAGVVLNSWLLERWIAEDWVEGLELLRKLFDFGKIELCGTASHHALVPLVPEPVAFRQIRRNTRLLQHLLRPGWRPAGFMPPELAYGPEVNQVLPPLGFRWCLADDSAFGALQGYVPKREVLRCGNLVVLLCSRMWSARLLHFTGGAPRNLAGEHWSELERWMQGQGGYQILRLGAAAGPGISEASLRGYLEAMEQRGVLWCHPSKLLDSYPEVNGTVPPGSARTTLEEFWSGQFFAYWRRDPEGRAWQLSGEALELLEAVHERLDELLSSSTFEGSGGHQVEGLAQLVQKLRGPL